MSKIIHAFFIALVTLCTWSSQAQINDEIRSASGSSSYNSSSDDDLELVGECCSALFSDVACSIGTWLFADLLESNVDNIIDVKDDVPRITSLDLELPVGIIPDNYITLQPRLKLNGGWFGTDIRTHHGIERRLSGWDTYSTIDWQILKLNFINSKAVSFGIGNGFVYETFSKRGFYEATSFLDVYLANKWRIGGEVRYASDASNERSMRVEGSLTTTYALFTSDHFIWNVMGRFMYAKYYEVVDIWSIQFGTSIRVQ